MMESGKRLAAFSYFERRFAVNKFPHLNDTAFPGTSNIDVYRYKNTFDYKRWGENVKIKVMQVPWDGINDVPISRATKRAMRGWIRRRAKARFSQAR